MLVEEVKYKQEEDSSDTIAQTALEFFVPSKATACLHFSEKELYHHLLHDELPSLTQYGHFIDLHFVPRHYWSVLVDDLFFVKHL